MYNWIDGRKISDSKYFPKVNFIPKNSVPFFRNQFEINNFRRLPVIKEEDGYTSEEDLELPQNLLRKNSEKKPQVSQKDSQTNSKNENVLNGSKPLMKLPPLVNINCMMNTNIKQTHSIWDTKFGKRLISGKDTDENLRSVPYGTKKKVRPNTVKCYTEKFGDCQPYKPVSRRKPVHTQSTKNGGGNKQDYTKVNSSKKKSRNINRDKQNLKKISNEENEEVKKCHSDTNTKSTVKFSETPSREVADISPNVSSFSRSQRFLTECVQSILEGHCEQNYCEYCNESFQNVEELYKHKKQHEAEKEICLLCEKVFYSPNEFIQHLLTHEGVDRFSCKMCKKYFPSLRKYKQHCLDYHLTPPNVIEYQNQSAAEYVRKWLPKFECKRCKIEFDSEKEKEAHRRSHVRKDLAGAYLLSDKNLSIS